MRYRNFDLVTFHRDGTYTLTVHAPDFAGRRTWLQVAVSRIAQFTPARIYLPPDSEIPWMRFDAAGIAYRVKSFEALRIYCDGKPVGMLENHLRPGQVEAIA